MITISQSTLGEVKDEKNKLGKKDYLAILGLCALGSIIAFFVGGAIRLNYGIFDVEFGLLLAILTFIVASVVSIHHFKN